MWISFEVGLDGGAVLQSAQENQSLRRVLRGVVTVQGNVAGCSHATTLLRLLLLRTVRHIGASYASVTPRVLVDDLSLQWRGHCEASSIKLAQAAKEFLQALEELSLVPQEEKSFFLISRAAVRKHLAPPMGRIGLKEKAWGRNLGHEVLGTKVKRLQEKNGSSAPWLGSAFC